MDIQIVKDAKHHNVGQNVQKVCRLVKHQEMMYVDIHVFKTEVGNKENTQEFTVTLK